MTIKKKLVKKQKCYCNSKKKNCRACNETGIYKEYHYLFIDDKQKIAFGSDTLS